MPFLAFSGDRMFNRRRIEMKLITKTSIALAAGFLTVAVSATPYNDAHKEADKAHAEAKAEHGKAITKKSKEHHASAATAHKKAATSHTKAAEEHDKAAAAVSATAAK
jgi:cytochrome oxidase Cu insertion factor (SCO1/SenC/PrrC family)